MKKIFHTHYKMLALVLMFLLGSSSASASVPVKETTVAQAKTMIMKVTKKPLAQAPKKITKKPVKKMVKKVVKKSGLNKNGTSKILPAPLIDPNNPPGGK